MDDMKNSGPYQKAVAEKNQAVRDVASQGMGGLPMEPIDGQTARTLAITMNEAIDAFGAGQLDELKVAEPQDDLVEIPSDMAVGLTALSKLFEASKSGSKYVFAPEDVRDDEGASSVVAKIANATRDQRLVRELTAPSMTPPARPEAKPAPEKKKRDHTAFTGDTTNDNRKTAFTGDTTNDNRKV